MREKKYVRNIKTVRTFNPVPVLRSEKHTVYSVVFVAAAAKRLLSQSMCPVRVACACDYTECSLLKLETGGAKSCRVWVTCVQPERG